MPTIADLVEIPSKYGVNDGLYTWQGASLRPILKDPTNGYVRPWATAQVPRGVGSSKKNGYTIRTTRYRWTIWCNVPFKVSSACYEEMYDLLDPNGESVNIAKTSPVRNKIFNLWQQRKGLGVSGGGRRLLLDDPTSDPMRPFDFDDRFTVAQAPKQAFP